MSLRNLCNLRMTTYEPRSTLRILILDLAMLIALFICFAIVAMQGKF